jgi:prefoldin alpha subunit
MDLNSLNLGLDELVGGTGKEIFAPFGKGIFVRAKLISEELNVDVGNGNFVKKSIPETKELIEEQLKKLEGIRKELEQNLEAIGGEIEKIMKETHEKEKTHKHGHSHNHPHEHNHE